MQYYLFMDHYIDYRIYIQVSCICNLTSDFDSFCQLIRKYECSLISKNKK